MQADHDVCFGYNRHLTTLLMNQQTLWKLRLKSGKEVWSDFDREGLEDPWTRVRRYCEATGDEIVYVGVIVPGQSEVSVFNDETGLDKILISRGIAKNITDIGETVYSFMTFGKVESDGLIHIKKFFWPECSFLESEETREVTEENQRLLYVKAKN